VIEQTIAAMNCRDLQVWLGPAIGPAHFEVGDEVREAFVSQNPDASVAFSATQAGKWLADIYQLARIRLANLGVEQVYGGGLCTVSDAQRFYSYRRDGAATGRMASLIWRD
jgi:YfiH family protein